MTDIAQPKTDTDRALQSISMEALEHLCATLTGLDREPADTLEALSERLADALCIESGRDRVRPIPDNSPAGQTDHDKQMVAITRCLRARLQAERAFHRTELERLRVIASRLPA